MKPYKCPACPKRYQSENDRNGHARKVHGITDFIDQDGREVHL